MWPQTLWVCWIKSNHEGIGVTHLQEGYAGLQCKEVYHCPKESHPTLFHVPQAKAMWSHYGEGMH